MHKTDGFLKSILLVIAILLGLITVRLYMDPPTTALAQTARFDHVSIVASMFLYKGQQGLLVMDRRNANVWFIPKSGDQFQAPVFVIRLPFDKLDQSPQ